MVGKFGKQYASSSYFSPTISSRLPFPTKMPQFPSLAFQHQKLNVVIRRGCVRVENARRGAGVENPQEKPCR